MEALEGMPLTLHVVAHTQLAGRWRGDSTRTSRIQFGSAGSARMLQRRQRGGRAGASCSRVGVGSAPCRAVAAAAAPAAGDRRRAVGGGSWRPEADGGYCRLLESGAHFAKVGQHADTRPTRSVTGLLAQARPPGQAWALTMEAMAAMGHGRAAMPRQCEIWRSGHAVHAIGDPGSDRTTIGD